MKCKICGEKAEPQFVEVKKPFKNICRACFKNKVNNLLFNFLERYKWKEN